MWVRRSTANRIRQLNRMLFGVLGIVDTAKLSEWTDLLQDAESVAEIPILVPDQVEFVDNQVYYIVWASSPTTTRYVPGQVSPILCQALGWSSILVPTGYRLLAALLMPCSVLPFRVMLLS